MFAAAYQNQSTQPKLVLFAVGYIGADTASTSEYVTAQVVIYILLIIVYIAILIAYMLYPQSDSILTPDDKEKLGDSY